MFDEPLDALKRINKDRPLADINIVKDLISKTPSNGFEVLYCGFKVLKNGRIIPKDEDFHQNSVLFINKGVLTLKSATGVVYDIPIQGLKYSFYNDESHEFALEVKEEIIIVFGVLAQNELQLVDQTYGDGTMRDVTIVNNLNKIDSLLIQIGAEKVEV